MTTLIPKFDLKNGGATPTGAINRPIYEKLSDIVSVKDFGAIGDGTTDDSAAIQAAINSASSVYFPPGTYAISSQINLSTSRAILYGIKGKSILKATANNAILGIPTIFTSEYVEVNGLTFISSTSGTGTGIYSSSDSSIYIAHWNIVNCSFEKSLAFGINGVLIASLIESCDFGVYGTGSAFQAISSLGNVSTTTTSNINTIRNCEFAYSTGVNYTIEFYYGFKTIFENTVFENNTPTVALIHLNAQAYPVFDNCWFEANTGSSSVIKCSLAVASDIDVLTITNSLFNLRTQPTTAVIDLDNTSNKNIVFTNNLIAGGTSIPLATSGAVYVQYSGNFSTNAGITALPSNAVQFDTGIVTKATATANLFQSVYTTVNAGLTPVTLYTFPNLSYPTTNGTQMYLVSAQVSRGLASAYSAFAIVAIDNTTSNFIQNSTQAGITLSISGLVLSVVTNSATPFGVNCSITRIA